MPLEGAIVQVRHALILEIPIQPMAFCDLKEVNSKDVIFLLLLGVSFNSSQQYKL